MLALTLLMPLIGGPANLQGRLIFVGVLDGSMVLLYRLVAGHREWGRIGPLDGSTLMMILLAGFALQTCGFVWQVVIANGAIGAVLGWFFFPREGTGHRDCSDR